MADEGHTLTACRTLSCSPVSGSMVNGATRPSSSWSNTAGAASTHWPAPTHRSLSAGMCMVLPLPSEIHRNLVDTVDAGVVLVRQIIRRHGPRQRRHPPEQRLEDDLEFQPGQVLPEALVDAVAEGHVVPRAAVEVQLLGVLEDGLVPVGGQAGDDDA